MAATVRKLGASDLAWINLPEALWRAKVEGCPEPLRPLVARFVEKIDERLALGASLLLMGPSGVGKSGIAAVLAKAAKAAGFTAHFGRVWELREALRKQELFQDEIPIMDRIRDVHLLVLDDLRLEDATGYYVDRRVLLELILSRGERRRSTIVTTQMDGDALRADFPRLLENTKGYLIPVDVKGPDRMDKQAAVLRKAVLGD